MQYFWNAIEFKYWLKTHKNHKWDHCSIFLEFGSVLYNFDISHQSHMTLILVIITLKPRKIRDENWLFRKFGEFDLKAKLEVKIRQINVSFKTNLQNFSWKCWLMQRLCFTKKIDKWTVSLCIFKFSSFTTALAKIINN